MCEWGTYKKIEINGRFWDVDACIADQVQIIISRGIKTVGCCCGHGSSENIALLSITDSVPESLLRKHGYRFDRLKKYGYRLIYLTTEHNDDEYY